MRLNYPIKYAAMPIIHQVGWTNGINELERNNDVSCYIVSKCYVVEEKIKYNEDGSKNKNYHVVFPYEKDDYNVWKKTEPMFNINNQCYNGVITTEVFDSYDDALTEAMLKNKALCEKTWSNLPFTDDLGEQISLKQQTFSSTLEQFKILEKEILEHTSKMKVIDSVKQDYLIKVDDHNIIETSCFDLYHVLNLYSNTPYVVSFINKEQYNLLASMISCNADNIESIIGKTDYLIDNTTESIARLIDKFGKTEYFIDKESIIPYSTDLEIELETKKNNEIKSSNVKPVRYYTTDTLEDVIESLKQYKDIDMSPKTLKKQMN